MQTIDDLLALAEQQTPPEAAIPFLEAAVRLADAQQDREAGFRARVELVRAASFSGFPDKALIHFAWLMGTFDRHRAQFEHRTYYVMWMYKWILAAAIDNPAFPLTRLQRLEADFERRAREYGFGAHYQAYHRLMLTKQMGDVAGAQAAFLAWRSLPRDMISDCEACEQNKVMGYYAWRGNAGAAVKLGREIIDQGMSCHNVPTVTYANLLLPLLATGDAEGARHAHREGLRLARLDRNFIETIAEHVRYLLVIGEMDAALRVWAEHLSLALSVRNRHDLFEFLSVSAALWRALEGSGDVRVTLPASFALRRADDVYMPEQMTAHFVREAAALAAVFDVRNGTDRFAERLRSVLTLQG